MPDIPIIKCMVVDDEPAARDVIVRYIQQLPMLRLVSESANAVSALQFLQSNPVDLLFLDIHMPQLKGTELLKILKHTPKTIFITAHEEYALQGYELDAVDYLLKPVQFERFLKAVQKALQLQLFQKENTELTVTAQPEPFVYFRAERKMVKVFLNDIYYIESMKDYVKVYTTNGVIITKLSISSLEELLPESKFFRSHRSYIVSLNKIQSYNNEIIDINKTEIPIGKLYRQSVLRILERKIEL